MTGPGSVSIEGAAQVLRPPRDRMQHLRGPSELNGQTIAPGDVAVDAGVIAGFERDPRAQLTIDASGCAVIPGFVDCHTHLPFAGWRAGEYEQKLTGVPYEEISRAGGGIKSSARALASMTDEQVLAQATALAVRDARHGDDDVRVQVRLRALTRGRAASVDAGAGARRAGRADDAVDGVAGALDPRRIRRRLVDGGRRGDDAGGAGARDRDRARHLRRVDRVRVGPTSSGWARWRRPPA